ncbi:MAG: NADP oxidoreductase [Streptosporangiales bacterium]|nr:NADP oxidoreductase [Streptosporangiales bacterium]
MRDVSSVSPLRVAVIGSGPAGLYTAEALIKQSEGPVAVDVFDRLPTPYGLVRYGVAPDHPSIKSIANYLQRVLESPSVRFLGCIEFGRDVTRADLLQCYHAVVYATGAMTDRRMGIPGEDLPGSVAATDFVNWYCGHPDVAADRFEIDAEAVAVIGVGNVAVDVVRILARAAPELRPTDAPENVIDILGRSQVRDIHMVGRRGPAQAKFTPKELRELGALDNADVLVRPDEVELDEASAALTEKNRQVRTNVEVLSGWASRTRTDKPRCINVRFWLRPAEILGTDRVEALRLERTRLDENGRVVGTGEYEDLPVQMVLRSVGYQSIPLPEVPFDESGLTVPHEAGRVLDGGGIALDGEYVAGWLKRGPTGVIGTNKSDAAETVRSLLADEPALRESRGDSPPSVESLLEERGTSLVTYDDWLAIAAEEEELGRSLGRERVKIVGWDRLLTACRRPS